MGKVIKGLLTAAVLIGVGVVLGPATLASVLVATGVSMALATTSQALFGPKVPKGQLSRLNASFDPQAHRKFVIGQTAMNTDIRYYEPSGTDQEYFDYIIATAAHEVESIDEIYFDDVLAWSSAGGVTATYSGYLTVTTRLVGTSANTIAINGGGIWGSSCRLTGCSYIHFRVKRTGNTKKAESPLVNGLPTRLTIKGKGAKLYDPRRDSTVAGGSGTERANDQTTWGGGASTNRDNPALQLLWFLLGWKINGKLSVGCGVPYERIDMPSFITAANICDEAIALAGGGTQPRYRTAGAGSDADTRMDVIQLFLTCMNGTLRDSNGRLSLQVMKNDLATPVLEFDDNDILDDFTWNQTNGLDKSINAVHGKYTDPTTNSLYQPVEYPSISIASPDGIERLQTLDLPWVEDGKRAQRIAKQVLQRAQYRGTFSANFTAKALGCKVGDVVYLTFSPLGWTNKPFRVLSQVISSTGRVPMTMIEENAAIYAWDAEEQPLVTATAPTVYDPLNSPYILGTLEAGTTADWSGIIDDNGNKPEDNATVGAPSGTAVAGRLADTVAATIKSDGVVNSNKVITDSIVNNSVNVPVYAYTSGSVNISSYQTIQSVSITTSGSVVKLDFSFLLAGNTSGCNFRLTRNGTDVIPVSSLSGGSGGLVSFTIGDAPAAGTYTYALLAQASGTVPLALMRSLFATEIKK